MLLNFQEQFFVATQQFVNQKLYIAFGILTPDNLA